MEIQGKLRKLSVVLGCCVLFIVTYTILKRYSYPYDLEWYEGTFLTHALRFLEGKQLYSPPSADFVPFLYTPLFPMISSVFMRFFGVSIPVMRSVSIMASLGTAVVLFLTIKGMTKNNFAAFMSSLLFVSTYKACDFYFDVARVDPLNLFWLALGVFFIKTKPTNRGMVYAGLCLALSYASKQSSTIFVVAIILALAFQSPKRMAVFAAVSFGSISLFMYYLTYTSDGWAKYYIAETVGKGYAINPAFILINWIPDLTVLLPGISFFLLCFLSLYLTGRDWKKNVFSTEFAVIAACITASFLMRNKWGGVRNVLMPLSYAGCLAGGIVLGRAEKSSRHVWFRGVLYAFLSFQFVVAAFNPEYQVPTKGDTVVADGFIKYLRGVKGSVLMPHQPYLPYMAGKKYNLDVEPLRDITRIDKNNFPKDLYSNISQKKYSQVIVSYLGEGYVSDPIFFKLLREYYYNSGRIFPKDDERFYTKTGFYARPEFIFLPKN